MTKKAILCILDGWGIAPAAPGNAITEAKPQVYQHLLDQYPHTELDASGPAVGLPKDQDGNSETGHLNIGAGRIVFQDLALINMAIADGSFFTNPSLLGAVRHMRSFHSDLHLLGMIGSSGVHSFNDHLYALMLFAKRQNLTKVYLHLITDGRDSAPDNALAQIKSVEAKIKEYGLGEIVSVIGRYYAMDRDLRLDRTGKAYDCLVGKLHSNELDASTYIQDSYDSEVTDEFILPSTIGPNPEKTRIKAGDAVIFFNFRTDRPRQLTEMFLKSDIPNLHFVTMTKYRKDFDNPVLFPTSHVKETLGEVIYNHDLHQLRAAETEKIAMVTYYFNGQTELPFPNEDHLFIDSPKVATYDVQPAMSTPELVAGFAEKFSSKDYTLGVINIACPDMVAHTGKIPETIAAIRAADEALAGLVSLAKSQDAYLFITADHGNAEELIDFETGKVNTEHSTQPVPLIIFHPTNFHFSLAKGKLGDIAPTLLSLLEIPIPAEMTGNLLVKR